MQRNKYIAARLQEVLIDGYWIANTNYKSQIQNLSYDPFVELLCDTHSKANKILSPRIAKECYISYKQLSGRFIASI